MISAIASDRRRGFTLLELLIGLTLLLIVSAGFQQALTVVQRTTRTQSELASMRGAIRGGLQIVSSDLQELETARTAGTSDIVSMSPTAIIYDALRASGVVCSREVGEVRVRANLLWAGLRAPRGTDRLRVFADGPIEESAGDQWLDVGVTSVTPGTCGGGEPAWVFATNLTATGRDSVVVPAPLRVYERMELGLVSLDGQDWLGIRSISAGEPTLVPLAGPLRSGGVRFRYLESPTSTTPQRRRVSIIELTLFGETAGVVNQLGVGSRIERVADSLTMRVQLRNSR